MLDTILSSIIWVAIIGNLILGIIVITRNYRNLINISLFTFAIASAIWATTLYFFQHPIILSSFLWLKIVYMVVLLGAIPAFFFFSLAFSKKTHKSIYLPLLGYYLISLPFAYTIISTDLFLANVTQKAWGPSQTLGPAYVPFGIFATLTSVWTLLNFTNLRKTATRLQKTQIKYIFAGLFLYLIIPIILDIILPIIFHNSQFIWFSPISSVFFVFITAYIIVKHRFLDIRLVIARSVAYLLLISTMGIIYAGGLFFVSSVINKKTTDTTSLLTSTSLALIIAFTFQPLLRLFERITNKVFYKNRYDEDKLLKTISHTMASTLTLSTLAYKILDVFISEMNISKAYFAILSDEKLYVIESSHKDKHLELSKPEFDLLKTKNEISVFEELEEGKIKDLFREKEFSLTLPIKTGEHFIGFLILAEKSSGDIYFDNDINLLEIIGPELAIGLQNAQRFEEIKQFNIVLQSEVEKATENLKEANIHLKDLDKMKDEFISVASHELRTPMTAIKGFLWLALNKHKLPKKTKETLEEAYLSTERSISLVNDMLDVSRIESGKIGLNPKKTDLVKLAIKVQNQLNSKITEKDLKFQIENSKQQFAVFDQDKILQVFINLVGNAIKFTPEKGTISISFKDKNGYIETSIADTGIGIKKENFSKLFHKFGRLDSSFSSVSESPGTGLGLYITKQIIELSGGKISVTSKLKKGTTFTFTLPKIKNTK